MTIDSIIQSLEKIAPLPLQEDYDNAGLLVGESNAECSGVLLSLDVTEDVIDDALQNGCNLIVAHHPIIFRGLKKINGKNYVEKTIIKAIKNDIAIYAIHTNLDNVSDGVNARMASVLGLNNCRILSPKKGILQKLAVYIPLEDKEQMMQALFDAGAGEIGHYSECSFASEGTGTFKPGLNANPYSGEKGIRHAGGEYKLEVIFPKWLQSRVLQAMRSAHKYEEIAFDLIDLSNTLQITG
ncbi:MAG: Nif3-like dinuclear metal center hexameric protein, partial [Ferruginibacter sp.]|nr:Nif3-like dinuclear metal center hexameric protein [Ferruginibacter sp.]